MSGFTLRAVAAPALRVDLRGVLPGAADVERIPVGHGNALVPLGEFFRAEPRDDGALVFDADLARFDRVGWQMAAGEIRVEGSVGDQAGAGMSGGTLRVSGNARDLAGCEMAGGTLEIAGDAGDFVAGALPGSMDGMRGGTLVVRGNIGARGADRMRRGTLLVFGNAGDFLASRLVAGTIALAGRAGVHVGYGMRRGSVVFAGPAPETPPTFVPALADALVFWQLLARDLARHGGPFAALPARHVTRALGDVAAGGKGELILVR